MGDKVRGSGLAHGACRPLIAYGRGVVGSTGSASSEGAAGGGAAHKNVEAPRRFGTSGFLIS